MRVEDYTLTEKDELRLNPSSDGFIRKVELLHFHAYKSTGFTSWTYVIWRWLGNNAQGHFGRIIPIQVNMNDTQTLFTSRHNPGAVLFQSDSKKLTSQSPALAFELLESSSFNLLPEEYVLRLRITFDDDTFYPETVYRKDYRERALAV